MQEKGKLLELRQMLAGGLKPPVLVFVATKERAKALCKELMYEKARVDAIHADQSHAAREAAVTNFRNGKTWVLITTDLLARGMDFLGVQAVVNYDFPGTKTDYIHRRAPLQPGAEANAALAQLLHIRLRTSWLARDVQLCCAVLWRLLCLRSTCCVLRAAAVVCDCAFHQHGRIGVV